MKRGFGTVFWRACLGSTMALEVACATAATSEIGSNLPSSPNAEVTAQAPGSAVTAGQTQGLDAVRIRTWAELEHAPEQVEWYSERLLWIEQNTVRMRKSLDAESELIWTGSDPHGLSCYGTRVAWLSYDGVQTFDLAASKTTFIAPNWRFAKAVALDAGGRAIATQDPPALWYQTAGGRANLLRELDANSVPHRIHVAKGDVWYQERGGALVRLDQQARATVVTRGSVDDEWWIVGEPARLFVRRKPSGTLETASLSQSSDWSRIATLSSAAHLTRCGIEVCWYEPDTQRLSQSNGNRGSRSFVAALGRDATLHASDDSHKVAVALPQEPQRTRLSLVEW